MRDRTEFEFWSALLPYVVVGVVGDRFTATEVARLETVSKAARKGVKVALACAQTAPCYSATYTLSHEDEVYRTSTLTHPTTAARSFGRGATGSRGRRGRVI